MKKLHILIISLFITISTYSQEVVPRFVKLTKVEISELEARYNWNSEPILIINMVFEQKYCPYDNYQNLNKSMKWWNYFYKKIDLTNVANRFVFSNISKAKDIIDGKVYLPDNENYIANDFFRDRKDCFGIVVINKHGSFKIKVGEYTETEVANFIAELHE